MYKETLRVDSAYIVARASSRVRIRVVLSSATLTPTPRARPTSMASFASASASEFDSLSTCSNVSASLYGASRMISLTNPCRGTRVSFFTFHAPFTWLMTNFESPKTRNRVTPNSLAFLKPAIRLKYSDSLFVKSSPRYDASSNTTPRSGSRSVFRIAPAPEGPGLPRHAPSKHIRYFPGGSGSESSEADAGSFSEVDGFSSAPRPTAGRPADVSSGSVPLAYARLSPAFGGLVGVRVFRGFGDVGGARIVRRARSSGRALSPKAERPPTLLSSTQAAASASEGKDLCKAPLMPVTCSLASFHVRYTPCWRPFATP
jgi:hypothetical protein